jgi:hypothetical protein
VRALALALLTTIALTGCGRDCDCPAPRDDDYVAPEPVEQRYREVFPLWDEKGCAVAATYVNARIELIGALRAQDRPPCQRKPR